MRGMATPSARDLLAELEQLGTAQNRKVYSRHGVAGPMSGVSYANLGKLSKRLGRDPDAAHELAEQLWESGNHDARVLACMIADPARPSARQLEAWLKPIDNYVLSDAFSTLAARSPHAPKLGAKWRTSKQEFTAATGWNMLAGAALHAPELDDDVALEQIATIEASIHAAPNRTRHSMNQALIALGVRNERLRKAAVAAAKRIGKVEVDHGQTSCKTPDAAAYIAKTVAHRASRGKPKHQAARKSGAKASAKKPASKQATTKKVARKSAPRKAAAKRASRPRPR